MKTLTLVFFMVISCCLFIQKNALAQHENDSTATVTFSRSISSENFNRAGYTGDVLQLISGRVPGLSFTKKGSDPNVPATLSVRGYSTDNYPSGILCIIDGVYGADPRYLSPEDIESFEVLTDAAATAIYGSMGRAGAILITTKSHQGDRKMGVDFSTTLSLNRPTKKLDVLSAEEYRAMGEKYNIEYFLDEGASTDWQEEIFRNTVSQNYNLGFSGNLNKTGYRISVFHRNNQGIVNRSGAKNTGVHLNLSQKALKNRLTLRSSIHYAATKGEILPPYQTTDIMTNVFINSLYRNPTFPVYEADGKTFHQYRWVNPLSILEYTDYSNTTNNLFLNLNGQYLITKDLTLSMNTGFMNSKYEDQFNQPRNFYNPTGEKRYLNTSDHTKRYNWEARLSYRKNINDHNFGLNIKYFELSENIKNDDEGTDEYYQRNHKQSIRHLVPQIDYSFKKFFFISALVNREFYNNNFAIESNGFEAGSLYLLDYSGKNKFNSFFPAVAAGMDISRNIGFFDELMVKVGYGVTGHTSNAVLEDFLPYSDIPDMEKTHEFSVSLNFKLPGERFTGSLLYYKRDTKNLIRHVIQTVSSWWLVYVPANDAWVRNSGIEALINFIPVKTERINWNTTLSFFSNKNCFKSTKLEQDEIRTGSYYFDGTSAGVQVFKTGSAYPSFYLPKIIGYETWGDPIYETYNNGNIKYYIKGQTAPKFEIGWNNNLCFTNKLALAFSFRYAGGYEIFNGPKLNLSNRNNISLSNLNHNGLSNYDSGHETSPYDENYLEDASFLRMENITLGYTFKPINENTIKELNLFIGADNLFTITGYSGYDPAGYSSGIDNFNVYPLAKSYFFGLRMNL